ncbi:MAG TPA: ABC transporter permease [Candidatus Limiplasma sp.]|nr:ABC transporter permease [Candidatus Limiplasma sp.]
MNSITATLAKAQLKQNRKRTVITMIGIVLSVAMLTAVCGFAASGIDAMRNLVGDDYIAAYQSMFVSMAAVLGAIIMAASVVVISGAFRISASERMRQFGILKSVGATKRQITKTMLYEAVYLCAISIPTGIVIGLLIQWLGASIGDLLLAPMNKLINNGLSMHMRFVFSWQSILIAILLSLVTVMLSAWLPARKAAKIPAIEAIKLTREIKVRKTKLRTNRLIQAIFGFEGTLAAKAIKRSRRSYRAMVTALTISIVLFLVCGNLNTELTMAMNQLYANIDANSLTTFSSVSSSSPYYNQPLDADAAQQLTDTLLAYPDTTIYGVGVDGGYALDVASADLTDTMLKTLDEGQTVVGAALVIADQAHYEALCKAAGVAVGSNILINTAQKTISNKDTEFQPLHFSGQTLTLSNNGTSVDITLDAQLISAQVPQEVFYAAYEDIIIVVPDCAASQYYWFGNSADLAGFLTYAENTMAAYFPLAEDSSAYVYGVTDITAITDMTRSLTKLVTIFLYGFVIMLTLIGLTSVIAAISANVRLRAREFAALRSVGMTQGGLRRMLALESVMSSLKALLYGLPLGSIAMYFTYRSVVIQSEFQFVYPWATLIEVAAGVFLITLITTQYAAAKLRGGSIIETIRSNEGV